MGLGLAVVVHPADLQDRDGAQAGAGQDARAVAAAAVGVGRCRLGRPADRVGQKLDRLGPGNRETPPAQPPV